MQNILIIGGSNFIGPHIIRNLLNRGHNIAVFNRGRTQKKYPKEIRFIQGDRNSGFPNLGHFQTIIDMCAYKGYQTERALSELSFDFFIHMGTAAAYKKTEIFPLTEESPLGEWPLWGKYNKGKVECEEALINSDVKFATARPVYILGPKNYLARESFIYAKIKNGLPIILPGNGQALTQFVFAEEVAEAIAGIAENKTEGAFNIAGDDIITLKGLVEEMAKISVVVATYNRDHLITRALTALVSQNLPKDFFEIIVVNDGSSDKTEEKVKNFIEQNASTLITLITLEKNLGSSFARNAGILSSGGEFIAITDDDCIAPPEWLYQFLSAFETNKECIAVGGWKKPH